MDSDWKTSLLDVAASIKQAICNLNATGLRIVMVVDDKDVLQGTVTDGDIRRGLVRGLNLDSPITQILNRDAFVVSPLMDRESILHLMQVNQLSHIPVVNEQKQVVGLYAWDNFLSKTSRTNLAVIMAGGVGSRLRPYTESCPKPMLPVSGKPMLEHIVQRMRSDGFEKFVFGIHYLGHMIEDYFRDGKLWNVHIEYLRETTPLGTAGALSLLKPIPSEPLLVSNGDVLTDIRYSELLDYHIQHKAVATMAVRQHEWKHPFGVVQVKGVDLVGFDEKPVSRTYVNAGIYILEPEALAYLNEGESCDMPILFERLRKAKLRTIIYPIHESWVDLGDIETLQHANKASVKD